MSIVNTLQPRAALLEIASKVDAAMSAGDAFGALGAAAEAYRQMPSAELERLLVRWRMDAFAGMRHAPGRLDWPPRYADPFPDVQGLPAIEAKELTADLLGGAILHHGALWVRGLASSNKAEELRLGIERAFEARDAFYAGDCNTSVGSWYAQAPAVPAVVESRPWVEQGGGVWTADSPRMLAELIELFEAWGIRAALEEHLGERPALSLGKSTLRRVPIDTGTDWHQDGSFLGHDVRTVNVWMTLSDCGEDAAGLDIVPRRLPYVLQTGSHGAQFPWSVGPGLVDMLVEGGVQIASPVFRAGDALLFDQLMLHRTGARPWLTKPRWAIETWFFAPSTFPMDQGPVVI